MIVYVVIADYYDPKKYEFNRTLTSIRGVFASYDSAVKYVEDCGANKLYENLDDEHAWAGREEHENFGVEYSIQQRELLA